MKLSFDWEGVYIHAFEWYPNVEPENIVAQVEEALYKEEAAILSNTLFIKAVDETKGLIEYFKLGE